jgi:hypothetical protein
MIDLTKLLSLKVPAAGAAKVGLEPPGGHSTSNVAANESIL